MTTLLTFLGVGKENRGYDLARYRFDCGFECETKLFGAAALQKMRHHGQPAERCVIIGTPTSGWDNLYECVATLAPDAKPSAEEWALEVADEMAGKKPVLATRLREFESKFSAALSVELCLITVDNSGDEIFAALNEHLPRGSRVVADITHAFRTMPLNALLALGALRWLKDIEVEDILYGSFDTNTPSGAQRAHSLTTASRLARFTPALAQLALVDDVGHIAELFESVAPLTADRLRETQRLESLMQYTKSRQPRSDALQQLRQLGQSALTAPFDAACAKASVEVLGGLESGAGSAAHLARAKTALAHADYMRALALANEALLLRIIDVNGLRAKASAELASNSKGFLTEYQVINGLAKKALEEQCQREGAPKNEQIPARNSLLTLGDARNSVMHAGSGVVQKDAPSALGSAKGITDLLNWSFRFYDFIA